jgi:hypothetical protein
MGYALSRDKMICLDMGHFHPTESVADKLSSVYLFFQELLSMSAVRCAGIRDHVVIFNDDVTDLTRELVRCGRIKDTHIGLDFFDGTMNRIGAYAIGSRAVLKGLLAAFLEPHDKLKTYDLEGNAFARLALLERARTLPIGTVWDRYCEEMGVVSDSGLIDSVMDYERMCWREELITASGMDDLITLSREYGSDPGWVVAGGGNTSWKDGDVLYVKASGYPLATIGEDGFARMDRRKLAAIWETAYPEGNDAGDVAERERLVLQDMMNARIPGEERRPQC